MVETGASYDNPARALKRVGEGPKELKLSELAQFGRFVEEIQRAGGRFSANAANLVCFLAFGGFRKLEASFITWDDTNLDRGEIRVRGDPATRAKNGETRRVPMMREMRRLLEELREERAAEPLHTPVIPIRECQKAMSRAAGLAGMARITHHDLRHLFATCCAESGVDIPSVARWLGHKDGGAMAMKVYGHLRDAHSASMAQKVTFAVSTKDAQKIDAEPSIECKDGAEAGEEGLRLKLILEAQLVDAKRPGEAALQVSVSGAWWEQLRASYQRMCAWLVTTAPQLKTELLAAPIPEPIGLPTV